MYSMACLHSNFFWHRSISGKALHTNYHAYNLHEPKCISGAGDAIHAESVHHHFPP
uniref:Alternative protein GRM7 n=1 Tax=Homo sapiens TaxID=9606 RepID=L8E797_HUMAN|nr:alternative protein GRM7 [Homo sapiens]